MTEATIRKTIGTFTPRSDTLRTLKITYTLVLTPPPANSPWYLDNPTIFVDVHAPIHKNKHWRLSHGYSTDYPIDKMHEEIECILFSRYR